jgi:TonB family protein
LSLRLPFIGSSAGKGARPAAAGVWVAAATGAVALHLAGVAIGYVGLNSPDDSDDLGATAIEIGLEPTAVRGDSVLAPPGPDQDQSTYTPPVQEQKAVTKQTELPKDTPTDTDDPDRAVSPNDTKKTTEETHDVAKTEQKAQDFTPDSAATSVPNSETLKEGKSAAPVLGIGESAQASRDDWNRTVIAIFKKNLRYPADRVSKKLVVVTVSMTLNRVGHVLDVSVDQGSGDAAFDQEAVEMVRRSDPLPPPVMQASQDTISLPVPVQFRPRG